MFDPMQPIMLLPERSRTDDGIKICSAKTLKKSRYRRHETPA